MDGENQMIKITYSKERILRMDEFADRADLLSVLLEDEKSYTKKEVHSLLKAWLEKEGK